MRRRRFLMLSCALAAVVGLAVGSGGFTSAEADRGVGVDVVGDEHAYMALDYPDHQLDRDGAVNETVTIPVVTVTNQFTEAVTVTVDYTVSGPAGATATGDSGPTDLGVGETTAVSTTVMCPADAGEYAVSVEFGATADGAENFAETSEPRTVDYLVHCD